MGKKALLLILLVLISITKLNIVNATGDSTHTVTFLDWNGNQLHVDVVENGDSAYLYTHNRIGYVFDGWDGSIVNVYEDRVVTAVYVPKKYDISFKNLDGSVVLDTVLPHDYTVEILNDQVRAAYNLGWSQENTYDYFVIVEENYRRVFVGDNVIWHLVNDNFGTQIDEYLVETDGYAFTGWSPESLLIQGETDFLAQFEEITDGNVVIDPEDPETEILEFTIQDLTLVSSDLLEAEVDSDMVISFIDTLVNTLNESVLEFPVLESVSEDGVKLTIPKSVLVYAETNDIDLLINAEGYEILISNVGLNLILDNIVTDLNIVVKNVSDAIRSSYDLGEFDGSPVETIDIALYVSDVEISDYEIEVTTNSNHEVVSLVGEEYMLLDSTLDGDTRTFTLTNNSVLIKSNLTEKEEPVDPVIPVKPEERFDPIEWLLDLEISTLIVYGIGSYVVLYLAVYTIEFYRGKTKNEL